MNKKVRRIWWYVRKAKEIDALWGDRRHRRFHRLMCYKRALNQYLSGPGDYSGVT